MEAVLGRQDLEDEIERLDDRDEILQIDLTGRDPDDAATRLPYEKGSLLLRFLEETLGRERFDPFLRGYFDHFAFESVVTQDFLGYLRENWTGGGGRELPAGVLDRWIHEPGLPAEAPRPESAALREVARVADDWIAGRVLAEATPYARWSTQERLQFLRRLTPPLPAERLRELDAAFHLTASGNAEIVFQWLLLALRSGYAATDRRLEEFLIAIGRRKFIKPLYEELVKTEAGRTRALHIYRRARPGYHPISVESIDRIVGWSP